MEPGVVVQPGEGCLYVKACPCLQPWWSPPGCVVAPSLDYSRTTTQNQCVRPCKAAVRRAHSAVKRAGLQFTNP